MKKNIIRILITIVMAILLFYITLPALNFHSIGFWSYLFTIFIIFLATGVIDFHINNRIKVNKKSFYPAIILGGIFLILLIINVINSPLLNAKSYYKRITINEENNFLEDIKEVNFDSLPLLDKDSSIN